VNDYPIVALSCSAGGLDALTRVLAPLPADLDAAVLVLQHLPPGESSRLPAILGQDAATGATAVHRFGGTVIVSSPETSSRRAMPRATMIRDDITDHVVALDDVPGLLLALATPPATGAKRLR
jgi:chemotaxis response regulator CheB